MKCFLGMVVDLSMHLATFKANKVNSIKTLSLTNRKTNNESSKIDKNYLKILSPNEKK